MSLVLCRIFLSGLPWLDVWYLTTNYLMSLQYINVFNITTMKMLTLPIQDQSYLQKVRMQIHQETGIEKADQLLLLKDGIKPDENVKVIKSLWREHVNTILTGSFIGLGLFLYFQLIFFNFLFLVSRGVGDLLTLRYWWEYSNIPMHHSCQIT